MFSKTTTATIDTELRIMVNHNISEDLEKISKLIAQQVRFSPINVTFAAKGQVGTYSTLLSASLIKAEIKVEKSAVSDIKITFDEIEDNQALVRIPAKLLITTPKTDDKDPLIKSLYESLESDTDPLTSGDAFKESVLNRLLDSDEPIAFSKKSLIVDCDAWVSQLSDEQ
jgi:hypothetical protein